MVVITPETRPTKWISREEEKGETFHGGTHSPDSLKRGGRGELRFTVHGKNPIWCWQEVIAGWILMGRMCTQIGFLLLLLFTSWVFCTVFMVQQLLYRILLRNFAVHPLDVAICVLALPLGAAAAIPIQLMGTQRGSRLPNGVRSFSGTTTTIIRLSPHPADRHQIHSYPFTYYLFPVVFVGSVVGFAAAAEAATNNSLSEGRWWLLVVFSAIVGFGGALALAETVKMLMELWDISGLEEIEFSRVGSVVLGNSVEAGRGNAWLGGSNAYATLQRTEGNNGSGAQVKDEGTVNPYVAAGLAVLQATLLLFAAAAIGSAMATENDNIGIREGLMAIIWAVVLVAVTIGLIGGLWRWKEVEVGGETRMVIPATGRADGAQVPVVRVRMVRNVCMLQGGRWTRWTESGRREFWSGGRVGRARVAV